VKGKGIEIEVLLSEAEIAEGFLEALARRFLPERYFYWFPVSVRAWLQLCQDGPYRNFVRSDALVRRAANEVIRSLPPGPVEVISLGAGQGTKDLHLLTALATDRKVSYRPVDAGQSLLEMACAHARSHGIPTIGVKADITNRHHLDALTPLGSTPPRLLLLVGNTLGGFDPPAMLRALRVLLREHDLLLVDGELHNDRDTRTGYDNPQNREFAFAPLRSIGIQESDGELVFESLPDPWPGIHRLGKYFQVGADLDLRVAGEPFIFKAGERIRMNHSGKYERQAFAAMLADAGFTTVAGWRSEDERFLMMLAR
jgi:uncharacterized SAM-dependent methyltransferase